MDRIFVEMILPEGEEGIKQEKYEEPEEKDFELDYGKIPITPFHLATPRRVFEEIQEEPFQFNVVIPEGAFQSLKKSDKDEIERQGKIYLKNIFEWGIKLDKGLIGENIQD